MITRDEHMAFCKRRALEYVDAGLLDQAVASMGSDLNSHDETRADAFLLMDGVIVAQSGDPDRVRRWIEGFK